MWAGGRRAGHGRSKSGQRPLATENVLGTREEMGNGGKWFAVVEETGDSGLPASKLVRGLESMDARTEGGRWEYRGLCEIRYGEFRDFGFHCWFVKKNLTTQGGRASLLSGKHDLVFVRGQESHLPGKSTEEGEDGSGKTLADRKLGGN